MLFLTVWITYIYLFKFVWILYLFYGFCYLSSVPDHNSLCTAGIIERNNQTVPHVVVFVLCVIYTTSWLHLCAVEGPGTFRLTSFSLLLTADDSATRFLLIDNPHDVIIISTSMCKKMGLVPLPESWISSISSKFHYDDHIDLCFHSQGCCVAAHF